MKKNKMKTKWRGLPMVPLIYLLVMTLYPLYPLYPASGDIRIKSFSTGDFGFSRRNRSVIRDNRGVMFFANDRGVVEFDGRKQRLLPLPRGGAYALARGPGGRIYVGGGGELGFLRAYGNGHIQYTSLKEKIPPQYRDFRGRVIKIEVTPLGVIYLTDNRLFIIKEETVDVIDTDSHFFTFLYSNLVLYVLDGGRGLLSYADGVLVPETGGELLRAHVIMPYKENKLLSVTIQEGPVVFDLSGTTPPTLLFPGKSPDFFSDNLVTCGVRLPGNRIALGSVEKGLIIMSEDGGRAVHIDHGTPLEGNPVYGITLDAGGGLWLALERGVSFIPPGSLAEIAAPAKTGEPGSRSFSALIRSGQTMADDGVFFGGAFYYPEDGIPLVRQPDPQITVLPNHKNAVRFYFSACCYLEPGQVQYRQRLDGGDGNWTPWSDREYTEFNQLQWGTYTFRVQARNLRGEISEEASYTFRIKAPWHESPWFFAAQVLFIVSMLIASRLIERFGEFPRLSELMATVAVLVIFKYMTLFSGPLIGRYSQGIAFFKILMTVMLGLMLNPAKDFIKRIVGRITKTKKKEAP